jgi:hypothetical protein
VAPGLLHGPRREFGSFAVNPQGLSEEMRLYVATLEARLCRADELILELAMGLLTVAKAREKARLYSEGKGIAESGDETTPLQA